MSDIILNQSKYNSDWEPKKLFELGTFSRGISKHRPRNDNILFVGGGYPFIQTGDIRKANLFLTHHVEEYGEFGLKQSKLWPTGTLCITIAANIAETAILAYPMCFPDSVVGFIANTECSSELFMYYIFEYIKHTIKTAATGSAQDNINIEYLSSIKFRIPNKTYQDRIVSVLSSVDKKISLNKSINENLEQQLRTIYDYWFTQFDFPDEKGKPYRSSGGKMVWNEELKREIPEGWSVKKLSEICSTILGGTPSTTCSEYWNGTINWLNSGEVAQFPVVESAVKITESGLNNSPTELMPPGTTIISITGNIRASVLAIEACANQSVVGILETVELKYPFIHQFFLRKLNGFLVISTGNCQRHINKGTIDDTKILLPSPEILAKYYKITQPLYKAIMTMGIENKKLSNLRDWLLPMLMNGQATVAD